jgi:hypothetical protein
MFLDSGFMAVAELTGKKAMYAFNISEEFDAISVTATKSSIAAARAL